MPEILNRLNQKLTVRLSENKSIILEPNGKARISDKEAACYGVKIALDEHKIAILAENVSSVPKSAKTK